MTFLPVRSILSTSSGLVGGLARTTSVGLVVAVGAGALVAVGSGAFVAGTAVASGAVVATGAEVAAGAWVGSGVAVGPQAANTTDTTTRTIMILNQLERIVTSLLFFLKRIR